MKITKSIECKGLAGAAMTRLRGAIGAVGAMGAIGFLLTGCANFNPAVVTAPTTPIAAARVHGRVFGGQQPISSSAITLYAASTSGYAGSNSNILTGTFMTDANGNFNIGTSYTCTAGQQIYIVATGGNPGAGANNQAALMAALGDCANLNNLPGVVINELTTVAAAYALSPFMASTTQVGTSASNTAGLARAFVTVNKLVNVATGQATNTAVPAGAVIPTAELNTLADILATCINSASNGGSPSGACQTLFTATTPTSGIAPADTIAAAVSIAKNPASNVAALYVSSSAASPFQPSLTVQPNDFSVAILYKPTGLGSGVTATVDAGNQVWFATPSLNTVTVLAQTGAPVATLTGNGLSFPGAIAIDSTGNAWVANKSGNSLSTFSNSGGALANYTVGNNLNGPAALAFDATGNLWVANAAGSSVTEVSSNGSFVQQTTGLSAPAAIVIDTK